MTNTLNWVTAREVEFIDKLIPNPNATHELLAKLRDIRVALDGSFIHVDPRPTREAGQSRDEHPIYVIPAASLRILELVEPARPDTSRDW